MQIARTDHCVVGIADGKVLVVGGMGANGKLSSTEIYGPEDRFQSGPPLKFARSGHTCTLLADGRVLVAGGAEESPAEIWDPQANTWNEVSGALFPLWNHTATLLLDGRVLLAGGDVGGLPKTTLAVYDPAENILRVLEAQLIDARQSHQAARFTNGRVLLAGGLGLLGPLSSSEVFDPTTETILPAEPLSLARAFAGMTELPDGRILIVGGTDSNGELGNAEIYSENTGQWMWVESPMSTPRRNPFVTLIPSGGVLIAGGEAGGVATGNTDVFLPETAIFRQIGSLTAPRSRIAGVVIPGTNQVLATGGTGLDGVSGLCGLLPLNSVIQLSPAGVGFSETPDFDIDQPIALFGNGFSPLQDVRLSLTSNAVDVSARLPFRTVRTDANGVLNVPAIFVPSLADLGRTFTLTGRQGNTLVTEAARTFRIMARVSIIVNPTASPVTAGTSIPVVYRLFQSTAAGPLGGSVTVTIGPVSRTLTLISQAPGVDIRQEVCCIQTAGRFGLTIRYSGDERRSGITAPLRSFVEVTPRVLQSTATPASLPLLETSPVTVTFGVPSSVTPAIPAPTGTLTISGLGIGPTPLTLSPSLRGNFSSANFTFRPTPSHRPTACFSARYSGDANYPGQDANFCIPVGLGRTALQVPAAPDFGFGELYALPVNVTFPSEVNILTRNVQVSQIANTELLAQNTLPLLNFGSGQASTNALIPLQFNTRTLIVRYPGGGDLAASEISIPVQRRLIPTRAVMRLFLSPVSQPMTLQVSLSACTGAVDCSALRPLSGLVRFFDGTTLLGETVVSTAGSPFGAGTAQISNVTRPSGTRQLRAEYTGDAVYAPTVSDTLAVIVP